MQQREYFTIGQLANAAGVGLQTVRFYERRGLLTQPLRLVPGYRQYTADHLKRVRFIKKAQRLGFSLKEIKTLFDLNATSRATCSEVKTRADRKREEIVSKLYDLQRMKRSLEQLSKACDVNKRAMSECRVLECFEGRGEC
jgi:MerR family transcriptional regulator, copper efflux regulator